MKNLIEKAILASISDLQPLTSIVINFDAPSPSVQLFC